MIQIEQLTYTYPNGREPALQAVSLPVSAGEFVLLAGPSGAGKSTLLRCLNGLTPHFSGGVIRGRVVVNGLDMLTAGPQQLSQAVGFVFQDPESQAVLDQVEAEIAFGLENAAIPPAEMRLRVDEALNLLDLVHLRQRPLTTLSGGERQRVAIATALALRPRILAVDEPTSQLDPQSAEEVLQALVRLNEDLGLTIVLVEHRLERVLRYVDRLVYMENGRIVVDSPARTALAQMPQPQVPPLGRLGIALAWQPLPLTIKEGLRFAGQVGRGGEGERGRGGAGEQGSRGAGENGEKGEQGREVLRAEGVEFGYGRRLVLRGVDLTVRAGEVVALMGRNGSGKSTLLQCLVGLLRLARGEVKVNGRSTHGRDVADICAEVAYLPQNPDDLLFAETVADELATTLRNHRLDPAQLALRPQALLEQLGLAALAGAYPRDLSVGQRQRVALAAVAVTAPKLWLLDEPTRGLDYQAKRELVAICRRWQQSGAGILLVTHDVELVAQIADRIVILSQGEVIANGPAHEVLPASPLFAPQMARLFPGRGWLTVEAVLAGVGG
jgi:energy-coupling factor transport system ATP-binding protein